MPNPDKQMKRKEQGGAEEMLKEPEWKKMKQEEADGQKVGVGEEEREGQLVEVGGGERGVSVGSGVQGGLSDKDGTGKVTSGDGLVVKEEGAGEEAGCKPGAPSAASSKQSPNQSINQHQQSVRDRVVDVIRKMGEHNDADDALKESVRVALAELEEVSDELLPYVIDEVAKRWGARQTPSFIFVDTAKIPAAGGRKLEIFDKSRLKKDCDLTSKKDLRRMCTELCIATSNETAEQLKEEIATELFGHKI